MSDEFVSVTKPTMDRVERGILKVERMSPPLKRPAGFEGNNRRGATAAPDSGEFQGQFRGMVSQDQVGYAFIFLTGLP
jgi:hypothetical protein